MQQNNLPIANGTNVTITDENGKSRDGVVINQDNGYYLVTFPGTIGNEFWRAEFVKAK